MSGFVGSMEVHGGERLESQKLESPEAVEQEAKKLESVDAPENGAQLDAARIIRDDGGNEINNGSKLRPNATFMENGIEYKTNDNGKIYCIDGKQLPDSKFTRNGRECETDSRGELKSIDGISTDECQCNADKYARGYNDKYHPYDRAVAKGIEGVQKTANGGVSFSETDSIFIKADGTKAVVVIEATGSRCKDFDRANAAIGLSEEPDGYVWHHLDDYNVKDNTITLELVKDEAHNASKPHSGGCAQYDSIYGSSYNPPRKE